MTQLYEKHTAEPDTDLWVRDSLHQPESPPLKIRAFGLTDPGLVRSTNEDQFLIAVLTKALQVQQTSLRQPPLKCGHDRGYLFLVADGVGGSRGGQQASALAVDSMETFVVDTFRWFLELQNQEHGEVLSELEEALRHTDAKVWGEGSIHPELLGMGTTLTMAYSYDRELFLGHVGDSRCYLFRDGRLEQLTKDHTLLQDMLNRGLVRPEEVKDHQWRHVITNVVGGNEPGVRPEVRKLAVQEDDVLLLCSDGLTDMVPDQSIASILKSAPDPRHACERLMIQANAAGGRDNVTVIVARYETV